MKFACDRETLLKPLQAVQGVVERRQTLPILGNVLLRCGNGELSATATDMELELSARVAMEESEEGETTVPARKLLDICRSLPVDARLAFALEKDKAVLKAGRSRFVLSTLPAKDYPGSDTPADGETLTMAQGALRRLLDLTHFAMAHQDVRYYLNGMLLETSAERLRAVSTDGHRLAVADLQQAGIPEGKTIIVPRKAVMELLRLLGSGEEEVEVVVGSASIQANLPDVRLSSKLIDGRFPDYERVIPRQEQSDKHVVVDREVLRQSLQRAAILSNDKYRAIRLVLEKDVLRILANNPEQEQAEEELEVDYKGESLEIGFNVSYLIDALGALPSDVAHIYLTDSGSSCLITPGEGHDCEYIVMPMRL